MGGTGLLYTIRFAPSSQTRPKQTRQQQKMSLHEHLGTLECAAADPEIDYSDWIVLRPDGIVTIFTGRTELGQGLQTVLTALVSQGLELPLDRIEVIMGDTDICPDDGPTVGSSATWFVGWGFWLACEKIREDLIIRAASSLGITAENLDYQNGGIRSQESNDTLISAFDLGNGDVVFMEIDTV